ncbi:uncharacterized protein BKA55DRAFT_557379, partial [Fusarium redolens]
MWERLGGDHEAPFEAKRRMKSPSRWVRLSVHFSTPHPNLALWPSSSIEFSCHAAAWTTKKKPCYIAHQTKQNFTKSRNIQSV